jgi:hypothetical protein
MSCSGVKLSSHGVKIILVYDTLKFLGFHKISEELPAFTLIFPQKENHKISALYITVQTSVSYLSNIKFSAVGAE